MRERWCASPTCAGRSRFYDLKMADGADHVAVGIALSHRCDLLVAVAQGRASKPSCSASRWTISAHDEMHGWMLASLGERRRIN